MKVESKLLLALGLFFTAMTIVYWNWSLENAGGVMMMAGALLCFLPGLYYYWWSRRMKVRPEDDANATPQSSAGVVGAFPGSSIWPFTLGMGLFMCVLAMVFGIWLLLPGLGLAGWAFLGGTSEGRRGGRV
jgi:Cytochrome c oxidase subunit IV